MYDLKSRNILITGGSRGLGAVTAERFAREGANVVINYVSSSAAAEALAAELAAKYGVKAVAIQADMAIEKECHGLVVATLAALGGLDVIISNAGWTRKCVFSDVSGVSSEDWDRCYAINVKANLFLLQAALPTFNANPEGGALLVTSSAAATNTTGSSMAYAVSKAAGLHLMKCLAATQGPKVRVNAIQPGLLLTEWGMGFGEEKIKMATENAGLKKLATVEDCAEAFVFLAKADTVTGAAVRIDGGQFNH
ncbi:hypothetical protein BZA05DRAFT_476604 [Tricharina praecox]|uniref:uncharacterized protein n=1 Tax=Tricharina praecox TaxID=43433 RepID=UPI00221E585E|nr:uncharacterized protein BZA05DRAFT_476604 [Tricharina praecox]KAI5845444.1 hypothetical protein BZA05DRAFT_476604 [Tricharina praecox]